MDRPTLQQTRGRSKSSFSFRSDHSDKTKKSRGRKESIDLKETEVEKARRTLTNETKANPNAAFSEEQPGRCCELDP